MKTIALELGDDGQLDILQSKFSLPQAAGAWCRQKSLAGSQDPFANESLRRGLTPSPWYSGITTKWVDPTA